MTKSFLKLLLLAASALSIPATFATPLSIGSPPPDFALRSLDDTNLRLSEYRSEVVVLYFWAPWCGKCRDPLESLNSLLADHYEEGLQILAVSVDDQTDHVTEYLSGLNISFPVLADDQRNSVSRMYELGKLPLTLLIDREGNLRYVHEGLRRETNQQIREQLQLLVDE